ncbi:MAG: hypothetical protein ABFD44_15160, partial [Anaerolineaceae bacterium]
MKNKFTSIIHLTVIAVFACLSLGLVSCQAATKPTPVGETTNVAHPTGAPTGGADLTSPMSGLAGLGSYRQQFELGVSGTRQGSPVETRQTITRNVLGADEMVSVTQTGADDAALELTEAWLGGYHYSQDRPGASCRAEAQPADEKKGDNPAVCLPAVYGMQEAGREVINDQAAIHYTFDKTSLIDNEGVLK